MLPNILAKYRPLWAPDDPATAPSGTATPDDPSRGTPTPEVVVVPAAPDPAAPPVADPLQQRMNTLTAQRWAEKRRADEAEARARLAEETLTELRRLQTEDPGQVTPPAPSPTPRPPARTPVADPPGTVRVTPQEHADAVRREAMAQAYNSRVNETVAEGRKVHKDFDEKIVALKSLTGDVVPPDFVVAALETGRGADILHALGSDLAEADRILQLPLARQAVELTRLADKLPKVEGEGSTPSAAPSRRASDVSRAPPPIASRVGGGAAPRDPAIDSPEAADPDRGLSTAEWIKRRNADVAAKRRDGQVSLR